MTFTMPKWLVHLLVYMSTAAAAIATAAASIPKLNVPAGWLPAVAGGAGLVATGLHQVLGMFKPAAAPAANMQTVYWPPATTGSMATVTNTMAPEPAVTPPTPPAGP